MTDFSSGTALAKMIECSSAAASVPSYTTACSCSDALLRSFACRLLQKEQSAVVRATSSSTAAVVWVSDARRSSISAAFPAAFDAGPPLSSATSCWMAPAATIAALPASTHARLRSAQAAEAAACDSGQPLSSATSCGMASASMMAAAPASPLARLCSA